jgi:hypothetical protein
MNHIEQHKMNVMRALVVNEETSLTSTRMRARWSFGIKSWATWALKICNPWANTSWWMEYLLPNSFKNMKNVWVVDRPGNELQKQVPAKHKNHSNSSTLTFPNHCLHCHSKDQIILLHSLMITVDSLGFIFSNFFWKFGNFQGIQKIGWEPNRKKSQSLKA